MIVMSLSLQLTSNKCGTFIEHNYLNTTISILILTQQVSSLQTVNQRTVFYSS